MVLSLDLQMVLPLGKANDIIFGEGMRFYLWSMQHFE